MIRSFNLTWLPICSQVSWSGVASELQDQARDLIQTLSLTWLPICSLVSGSGVASELKPTLRFRGLAWLLGCSLGSGSDPDCKPGLASDLQSRFGFCRGFCVAAQARGLIQTLSLT